MIVWVGKARENLLLIDWNDCFEVYWEMPMVESTFVITGARYPFAKFCT